MCEVFRDTFSSLNDSSIESSSQSCTGAPRPSDLLVMSLVLVTEPCMIGNQRSVHCWSAHAGSRWCASLLCQSGEHVNAGTLSRCRLHRKRSTHAHAFKKLLVKLEGHEEDHYAIPCPHRRVWRRQETRGGLATRWPEVAQGCVC